MELEEFLEQVMRGREFEEQERAYWRTSRNEIVGFEAPTQWKGKRGRVDIRLDDTREGHVVIVELKASNWDKMSPDRIRPNALRHVRQIWRYIEAELVHGQEHLDFEGVLPAIVYSREPRTPGRKEEVEGILKERGVQVVWRS